MSDPPGVGFAGKWVDHQHRKARSAPSSKSGFEIIQKSNMAIIPAIQVISSRIAATPGCFGANDPPTITITLMKMAVTPNAATIPL